MTRSVNLISQTVCVVAVLMISHQVSFGENDNSIIEPAQKYVQQRIAEFDQIPDERKKALAEAAADIKAELDKNDAVNMMFVCTHNSRRSQMSQAWFQTAAAYYGIEGVKTFSGGTEASAFNPRAIAALRRAGLSIVRINDEKNPDYLLQYANDELPIEMSSKVYHQQDVPNERFVAIMSCSDADESCPIVRGASSRFAITYIDPKVSDGTSSESATYDERCAQIAREMFYIVSQVAK